VLKYLFQHEGKPCLAKTAYTLAFATSLGVVLYNTYMSVHIDYGGLSVWIGAVGAVYFGRSHTKS
jgi:hypothetical protein